uniref:Replication timing regulatory factor 1 n=1 Tax=Cyprinus carpio TaxID=7962 RepID=A0A8C1U4W3_CYPCA
QSARVILSESYVFAVSSALQMNNFFFQVHISSENEELCQAALQALGFCVFHSHIVSVIPANISEDILSTLCNVVVKSKEKFTCTRALWVISKQNFPPEVASKKTPEILKSLEAMQTREVQSILIEHESLNVIIRLLEQAPSQMAAGAVCWAKLVIPLVVHSANKVRLRAAAALELGLPLLLEKQQEVATIMLIPEMQKLFTSKNETNMLKLWPLFVRLLGKLLHKGGAFINSLLYLEELGFRNSSPNIKKIAFIAWKSLIDNFALNPDILCSSKRLKLLMQPLSSIQVRTEALLLTKLEVWWYLVVKLGPNLSANFEQVGVPLLHNTLPSDSPLPSPTTPARTSNPSNGTPNTPKSGTPHFLSFTTPRMSLNSSMQAAQSYRSIQLLGLEMLLHWLVGPEVTVTAARENLQLSLEPLTHPLFTSPSSFSRHASTLISAVKEGFITVGEHAPDTLCCGYWLIVIYKVFLSLGNKKERQGSEVLTLLLQALQSILSSDNLPAERALLLLEATVKGIPQKVLGSAAYQVANMDVLNGTPALFLILLFSKSNQFFSSLETLVSCGFCGPTSPLAFGEAVLGAISGCVEAVKNKKQLWRMWSAVVNPLTDTITQTNEVNQGDALEHNFSAIYSALMFPVIHLLPGSPLPQTTQKAMIGTWSRLYKAFARCSALVATAEENICCEELCAKISASLDRDNLQMLDAMANILLIIIESMDFSPYTPQFQQKMKSPRTPLRWVRKRSKALGNLSTFHTLLMQTLDAFLSVDLSEASVESTSGVFSGIGLTLVSNLSTLFTNITLPTFIQEVLSTLTKPLAHIFEQFSSGINKLSIDLEKLATDLLGCLQTQSTLHDDEMLAMLSPLLCVLFPHKSKQIRSVVTQFWNATFGNALTLTYPEPLKSVLSQAKQKTPLILPGFEAVDAPDDCSGSESSQLDPQISGVKMTSVGKRDSLLARAEELKGRGSANAAKPVKLDFGSPKPSKREAIEEEASVDFVFIPPETKERVLTEHQKEVKRTKRVDIPALYNNLDASLDTTAFSQYTQSQEESMYEVATTEEPTTDVKLIQEGTGSVVETPEKATQNKDQTSEKNRSPSGDVSVDVSGQEKSGLEGTSPNVSGSSDMISGTPPKPNRRRQSFITLEKYVDGKSPSPASAAFTGPHIRKSSRLSSSKALEATPNDSQLQTTKEDSRKKSSNDPSAQNEEVKDKMSAGGHRDEGTDEEEDDVVPDTQTQLSGDKSPVSKASVEEQDSPEKDSQILADSQASQEPRRSGRRRSKPVRPGEDPGEMKSKCEEVADSPVTNTQKPILSPTISTLTGRRRSKVIEDSKVGDQLNNKGIKGELSQSNSQISSTESSQAPIFMLGNKEPSQTVSSSDSSPVTQSESQSKERLSTLSESEGLSPGRPTRKTRAHLEESTDKEADENSQNDPHNAASTLKKKHSHTPVSDSEADSQQTARTRRTRRSESQLLELAGSQTKDDLSQTGSQTLTVVKGRAMRRRTAEEETDHSTRDATSTVNAEEISASQDSSEGLGRYRTRRSKGLLAPTDNTESENSDNRQDGPRPKKRPRKPLPTEVPPVATEHTVTEMVPDKEGVNVSMEMSEDEADIETSLNILVIETEELDQKYKEEVPAPDGVPHEQITSEKEAEDVKTKKEQKTETDKKEVISVKAKGEALNSSLQIGSKDLNEKTNIPHKCPHTRGRGRGRRRSRSCNCFSNNRDVFSQDSDFHESQDLKSEQVPLVTDALNSQPEQSSSTSIAEKSESSGIADVQDATVQPFSALPAPLPSEVFPSESPIAKLGVIVSQLSEAEEGTQLESSKTKGESNKEHVELPEAETKQLESSGCTGSQKHKEDGLENTSVSQEPLQSSTPQDTSPSQGRPVEDAPICQEQLESSHVQQEDAVNPAVKESEDLAVSEPSGEKVILPEESNGKELLDKDVTLVVKDEDAQIDKRDPTLDPQEETSVPPESSTSGACLDSPPKPKPLDALSGELEPGQSPSRNRSRGWSPSASPSTSILKKGQKRTCEEDTPSPLPKSRRVSFATPIYHQELADDIDRRSPVVRTSSPRSKVLSGQSKYITTPTKGYTSLSPRNLRSPGSKSSKKCLISEMSQEPRPIAKDCVYPALVACSTPVEAVLPHISSNMWSRGFGQLVRARNIKTVGDLSALTPSEIKSLPIRSPKLSNVRKALKTYHEQQVIVYLALVSSPLLWEIISNFSHLAVQRKGSSEVEADSEPMAEEDKSCDLLSDVEALSGRLTSEELGRCSPEQLGLMHEHLSGMMRSIVTHMQSRLRSNLDDSLP